MFLFIAFLLGIAVGSFLNVLIDRLPRDESIWLKRSHCENCKKNLAWFDLIPLFSYLALSGKCRYCKAKISPRLFFVELMTGIIFVLFALNYLSNPTLLPQSLFLLIVFCSFIVIFFSDLEYGIIPDQLVILISVASVIYNLGFVADDFNLRLISSVGSFVFFLSLFFITRGRGMGFGDVKLSFALGLFLGFPKIVVSHYLAFLTGGFISIILILWGKKKLKGGTVPFGPFMIAGAVVSYLYGEELLKRFMAILY